MVSQERAMSDLIPSSTGTLYLSAFEYDNVKKYTQQAVKSNSTVSY